MYTDFLQWAEGESLEFPCTADEFYARATKFAAGDEALIDALCQKGIGPNWRDD